ARLLHQVLSVYLSKLPIPEIFSTSSASSTFSPCLSHPAVRFRSDLIPPSLAATTRLPPLLVRFVALALFPLSTNPLHAELHRVSGHSAEIDRCVCPVRDINLVGLREILDSRYIRTRRERTKEWK